MQLNKEVLKGYIDILIVSILEKKDCYGYEIAKQVRERSEFELKEGTMYLALKRMESKNLIKSYYSNEQSSGGRRKYYNLTNEGKDFLEIKKQEWRFIKKVMNQFLGEVY